MRACARTSAGAAIFVQIGAENFSEMCVRVCAYIVFKVRTCAQGAEVRAHVRTSIFSFCSIFFLNFLIKKKNLEIFFFFIFFFFEKMCGCACGCGPKNWSADVRAALYENVCDVRAGADKNPRTLAHVRRFLCK